MPWTEIFLVFLVSHLVGDFLLQTEWQALNKYGGLGGNGELGALVSHVVSYTLSFVPGLIWAAGHIGVWRAIAAAALIAVPHLIQDDGRLLQHYIRLVKHARIARGEWLFTSIDQSFHMVALFGLALLMSSW